MHTLAERDGRLIARVIAKGKNTPVLLGVDAAVDAMKLLSLIRRRVVLAHERLRSYA